MEFRPVGVCGRLWICAVTVANKQVWPLPPTMMSWQPSGLHRNLPQELGSSSAPGRSPVGGFVLMKRSL